MIELEVQNLTEKLPDDCQRGPPDEKPDNQISHEKSTSPDAGRRLRETPAPPARRRQRSPATSTQLRPWSSEPSPVLDLVTVMTQGNQIPSPLTPLVLVAQVMNIKLRRPLMATLTLAVGTTNRTIPTTPPPPARQVPPVLLTCRPPHQNNTNCPRSNTTFRRFTYWTTATCTIR